MSDLGHTLQPRPQLCLAALGCTGSELKAIASMLTLLTITILPRYCLV